MSTVNTPTFKWAQNKESLFLTIELDAVAEPKVEITDEKFVFSGKSAGKDYAIDFEWNQEIVASESTFAINGREIEVLIKKAKADEDFWNHILKGKKYKGLCKIDWDKWVDEDEDEEKDVGDFGQGGMPGGMGGMPGGMGGMPGMGGMGGMGGGMGGMPGMGGMGGAGGMGGMDMSQLMAGMGGGAGGMGGMGGMGGAGGADIEAMLAKMGTGAGGPGGADEEADSDDEDIPGLEVVDDADAETTDEKKAE